MKFPWISVADIRRVRNRDPTPNPSTARPRMMLSEASSTSPSILPVLLPSRITRTCALLPSIAATVFGAA